MVGGYSLFYLIKSVQRSDIKNRIKKRGAQSSSIIRTVRYEPSIYIGIFGLGFSMNSAQIYVTPYK